MLRSPKAPVKKKAIVENLVVYANDFQNSSMISMVASYYNGNRMEYVLIFPFYKV